MAPRGNYHESLQAAMVALSQNFITASDDVAATLGRVTESAVELIDGVDYAASCSSKTANFGPSHRRTHSSPISMDCKWNSKKVRV